MKRSGDTVQKSHSAEMGNENYCSQFKWRDVTTSSKQPTKWR